MQLLESGDINTLTTNAVAAKAGVSIGTLYQYFGSKHALLDALVTRELGTMAEKIVGFGDTAQTRRTRRPDRRHLTCRDVRVWRAQPGSSAADRTCVDECIRRAPVTVVRATDWTFYHRRRHRS